MDEHKSITVKETIDTLFPYSGSHGIYRFIPRWLAYTTKDGKTVSQRATISELKCPDRPYTLDTIKGKERIKIGDPNKLLVPGNHTFKINYVYDMGTDPYNGFDEFIFHCFGDYWGTTIKNPKIVINMPKSIDNYNIFNHHFKRFLIDQMICIIS